MAKHMRAAAESRACAGCRRRAAYLAAHMRERSNLVLQRVQRLACRKVGDVQHTELVVTCHSRTRKSMLARMHEHNCMEKDVHMLMSMLMSILYSNVAVQPSVLRSHLYAYRLPIQLYSTPVLLSTDYRITTLPSQAQVF